MGSLRSGMSIINSVLRSAFTSLLAVLVFTARCNAQEQFAALASEVRTITAGLASQETLDAWQKSHPRETPQHADYQADENWPDSDFRSLSSRCAFSVANPTAEITRTTFFVVPLVTAGRLPAIPASSGAALIQGCQLEESWLETRESVSLDSLVRVLSSSWGEPNGPSRSFRDAVWSVGRRKDIVAWHRAGMNVWVVTDRQAPNKVRAIYARNDILPAATDWYEAIGGLQDKVRRQSAPIVAKTAALDSALTQALLGRTTCETKSSAPQEPSALLADRLEHWLEASKALPPPRRAAALLLADYYIPCLGPLSVEMMARYASMGAQFDHDGEYIHAWRDQAKDLDAHGVVGEWAALHAFWDKCNIAYGGVLETGDSLAQRFPEWRPDITYALARAHGARLSFAYPGGPPEPPDIFPLMVLNNGEMERERAAAIRNFRSFIREKPADPEAVFAWQEVWRLQAGLKPTRVPFGCTGE